ncbi:hypothetical protein SL103_18845 [Streptomyces lydicus]|uniref:Uncharacterized protein n=1 Tax=Streptomyces lydicus TaxID=47763 RepID=A0A1D7VMQ9_9ACTN|nr:hypothetical protein SL103_18845 [Streptomyces lydicus]
MPLRYRGGVGRGGGFQEWLWHRVTGEGCHHRLISQWRPPALPGACGAVAEVSARVACGWLFYDEYAASGGSGGPVDEQPVAVAVGGGHAHAPHGHDDEAVAQQYCGCPRG